jgi:hypothetical protein
MKRIENVLLLRPNKVCSYHSSLHPFAIVQACIDEMIRDNDVPGAQRRTIVGTQQATRITRCVVPQIMTPILHANLAITIQNTIQTIANIKVITEQDHAPNTAPAYLMTLCLDHRALQPTAVRHHVFIDGTRGAHTLNFDDLTHPVWGIVRQIT